MGYIEKSAAANEVLVGRAHFHWSYRFFAVLPLFIVVAAAAAVWLRFGNTASFDELRTMAVVDFGAFLLALLLFLIRMIRYWTTEIAVTNQRFVLKRGWLSLDTQEMALPNIEGVKVSQGFWGRILGYGHVRVEGTGVDAIQTPAIGHPVKFRSAIENAKFGGQPGK